MRVLVFEDNLLWSERFRKTLGALGVDSVVVTQPGAILPGFDVAIVNLGSTTLSPAELLPKLKASGVYSIGHAGHKEKELHELGREMGCDRLASNSEITYKLPELLAEFSNSQKSAPNEGTSVEKASS